MIYMIWFTSDLHFNHDKEFIWKARGFNSIQEMNEAIIDNHNKLISQSDTVYILGDLMLGQDIESGLNYIRAMKGTKIIISGNHDTQRRVDKYKAIGIPVFDALRFDCHKYHFYLSHYPTLTGNLEKESLKQCTLNLFGHTHQTTNFFYDLPYMYHVGLDSHSCMPVCITQVIEEMRAKEKECKDLLEDKETGMSEEEIKYWLEQWQMYQHFSDETEWSKIEKKLLDEAGLDMENDWENILKSRGLIQ